jgi:AcrR family transcriptional regulator
MVKIEKPTAPPAERMLRAAADLLRTGGIDAVSTRAVAVAASVQPPTIYRLFGDKDGLLDAVAGFVLQGYLEQKRLLIDASTDPAIELRGLWDLHVEFGLKEPHCYVLTYGQARPGRTVPAAEEAIRLLTDVIARLGDQGRLRMSVDRATAYFRSCGAGYILTQIGAPPAERDPELSSIMFEHLMAATTTDAKPKRTVTSELPGRAVALREALRYKEDLPLTAAERHLLSEWLNRLADSG